MELIAAIATAHGRGGISVIRVSGDGALPLARKMFSRKGEFEPNKMYAGEIDCGAFRDFGLCVYFRAPRSFTGEDVVEFHTHGGEEIARGALRRALSLGARMAEGGEFTKRAFLNGKLSLSAAEGMAEMINARSAAQVRAGYELYGERLTARAAEIQSLLKSCLAEADADMDYPEEDLSTSARDGVLARLREADAALGDLLKGCDSGRKLHTGVTVAICGRPNAGKSSLFNALLGYDRAIVSPAAGTTRDTVEGTIEIGGVLFRLVDTAGLRQGADEVEAEGIRRAERAAEAADVIVYLREEGDAPPAFPAGTPVITVGAKSDLARRENCDIALSSLTGEGLDGLRKLLYERGYGAENDGAFYLETRHCEALGQAREFVRLAIAAAESGAPAELYAEDVSHAWRALGRISGETETEAVIAEIFGKFCVGK